MPAAQNLEIIRMFENEENLNLSNLIDIKLLQKFQDAFSKTTNLASLIYSDKKSITKPNNFTDFCIKYTKTKKCNEEDIKWGKIAFEKNEPIIYTYDSGIVNFVVPIIVAGKHIGTIYGGQVFIKPPNENKHRKIAKQIKVDEDKYIAALKKIKIKTAGEVKAAAQLLFIIANTISEIGQKNLELIKKDKRDTLYRVIMETIRSSLDINKTKTKIVNIIGKTFNTDRCFIVTYEPKNDYFYIDEYSEYQASPEDTTFIGSNEKDPKFKYFVDAFNNRQEINYSNVDEFIVQNNLQGTPEEDFLKNYGIKSGYDLPIYYANNLLGYLVLEYTKDYKKLDENDLEFLRTICIQAGIAIRQANLYKKLELQTKREKLIWNIIAKAISTLDINQIRQMVTEVGKMMKADRCYWIEADPEHEKRVKPIASDGEYLSSSEIKSIVGYEFLPEHLENAFAIYLKKSDLVVFDFENFPQEKYKGFQTFKRYSELFNTKSAIGVPFIYMNEVKALLSIEYVKKSVLPSDDELNFLRILGNQIGMAINQIQLYLNTKKTAEKENLLRKIFETMRSSLDINVTKNTIVTEVGKALDADVCFIVLYDVLDDNFYVDEYSEYRLSAEHKSYIGATGKDIKFKWFADMFRKNAEFGVNNIEKFLDENNLRGTFEEDFLREVDAKSGYFTPIYYVNNLLGYICLNYTRNCKELDKSDQELLRTIAAQAGIALYQANLYKITQLHAERENLLRKIFETMRSSLNINVIKSTIVNEIGKALNVDRCFIATYEPENDNFYVDEYSEYRSSPEYKSFANCNAQDPKFKWFADSFRNKQEINYSNVNEFITQNNLQGTPEEAFLRDYGIKSSCDMPIYYANNLLGYILLDCSKDYRKFDKNDIDFLRLIATQAGIAIHQANLYKITQIQAKREKMSRNIVEILRSSMDKNIIKSLFVKNIGKYFNADRVFFSEFDTKNRIYLPVDKKSEYLANPDEKSFVNYNWADDSLREYIQPLLEKRERKILCWEEYIRDKAPGIILLFKEANMKSSYGFPVLYEDKILGYFDIEFTQKVCRLLEDDINRVRSICTQAGIALYHAELYMEAQEAIRAKEKIINKVSCGIREPVSIIMKNSKILSELELKRDQQMAYLNNIIDSCNQLLDLTKDICSESDN